MTGSLLGLLIKVRLLLPVQLGCSLDRLLAPFSRVIILQSFNLNSRLLSILDSINFGQVPDLISHFFSLFVIQSSQ
jgi:hypothetical protein